MNELIWTLDPQHWSRPVTAFAGELFTPLINRASVSQVTRYGVPLARRVMIVNRFLYSTSLPIVPHRVKSAVGLYIAPDRLAAAATRTLQARSWRTDLRRWHSQIRPRAMRSLRKALHTDASTLALHELVQYVGRCRQLLVQMSLLHDEFQFAATYPVGRFLRFAQTNTRRNLNELLSLLAGTSPASAGDIDELRALVSAISADRGARQVLARDSDPNRVVAGLRRCGRDTTAALDAYVETEGYRLVTGFDVGDVCAMEVPGLLGTRIIRAVEGTRSAPAHRVGEVRSEVPTARRAEFDSLLLEAREAYRLRDERGLYTDIWAGGVTRRALLALGERLASQGRLDAADHAVEATFAELQALATNGGPDAAQLRKRFELRASQTWRDAPFALHTLTGMGALVTFLEAPPEPVMELLSAVSTYIAASGIPTAGQSPAGHLSGAGVTRGATEGPARIVRHPHDIRSLQPGDVFVTSLQSAGLNCVAPLVAAIVCDTGGPLSHAAVVARECGIPAVMACSGATEMLREGENVRVNADAGCVTAVPSHQ